MSLQTRPLTLEDIPIITEMVKDVWQGHDHLPHLLSKWLANPNCHPIVLTEDTTILGTGSLRILDGGMTGWMEALRVHPDHRGRGLGRRLTEAVIDLAEDLGVERLRLVTSADNEAPIKIAESYGLQKKLVMQVFWKWLQGQSVAAPAEAIPVSIDEYINRAQTDSNLFPFSCIFYKEWLAHDAARVDCGRFSGSLIWKYPDDEAVCLAHEEEGDSGLEWQCVINASTKKSFLTALNHQRAICIGRGFPSLFCIHTDGFESLYRDIEWLNEPDHMIGLFLFERVL